MLVITHLRISFIYINPYKTSKKNPLFSPYPIKVSMTESNFVRFSKTKSDSSSLKSSFHSFKLNTSGSTNLTNYFSNSWQELKLIKVDKQILVSFSLFITLFIYERRSVPKKSFFDCSVFVYCNIAFSEPYLTYIFDSLSNVISYWASYAVITFYYSKLLFVF